MDNCDILRLLIIGCFILVLFAPTLVSTKTGISTAFCISVSRLSHKFSVMLEEVLTRVLTSDIINTGTLGLTLYSKCMSSYHFSIIVCFYSGNCWNFYITCQLYRNICMGSTENC
jgi:hypothetical protein